MKRILTFFACYLIALFASAQCLTPLSSFYAPDYGRSIYNIEPSPTGDTIFIGGDFGSLVKNTGTLCKAGNLSATPANMPVVDGEISSMISDGSGGCYIGGQFSKAGGLTRSNIARIDKAGNVLPFTASINGRVSGLHMIGNKLFITGDFTLVNNTARKYLASLDTSGSLRAWNPAPDSTVTKIDSKNGVLLASGLFTHLNGASRAYLAQIDTGTAAALSWSAALNGSVSTFVIDDSLIYVTGAFSSVGATTRNNLAALRWQNGSLYTPFSVTLSSNVALSAIEIQGSMLYFSGIFSSVNTTQRASFAVVDKLTGNLSSIAHTFGSVPSMIKAAAGDIFIGGSFEQVDGNYSLRYLARMDAASGALKTWDPLLNAAPNTVLLTDTSILLGGIFNGHHRVARTSLAAMRTSTGDLLPFAPVMQAGATVKRILYVNNKLAIGGSFASVNSSARQNLACIGLDGQLSSWAPTTDNMVNDIAYAGGLFYIGGNFDYVNNIYHSKLAVLDADSGSVSSFRPNPNGPVNFVKVYGSKLYVGGAFNIISQSARNILAVYTLSSNMIIAPSLVGMGSIPVTTLSNSINCKFLEAGYGRVFFGHEDYQNSTTFVHGFNVISVDTTSFNANWNIYHPVQAGDLGGLALIDSSMILSIRDGGMTRLIKSSFDGQLQTNMAVTNTIAQLKRAGNLLFMYGYGLNNFGGSTVNGMAALSLAESPRITASRDYTRLCIGDSITLSSSASSGNTWSDLSTGSILGFAPITTSTYNAYVKAAMGSCPVAVSNIISFEAYAKPVVSIVAGKTNTLCRGDSNILQVQTDAANSIRWNDNSTSTSLSTHSAGMYTVTATNTRGCQTTASYNQLYFPVSARPLVSPGPDVRVCQDSTPVLTSGHSGNNRWLHGPLSNSVPITASGSYRVFYIDSSGCISDTSDAVNVSISLYAKKAVISTSKAGLCGAADSITLTTGNTSDSLVWSTGENGRKIVTHNPGKYYVRSFSGVCPSFTSDTMEIVLNPVPAAPVLTLSNDTLYSSAASNNSWYLNNAEQINLSGQAIHPTVAGTYAVLVTNQFGCRSPLSNAVPYSSTTGIDDMASGGFGMYPNPSAGLLYIAPPMAAVKQAITISVSDVLGRQLLMRHFESQGAALELNLSNFDEGTYLIRLQAGDNHFTRTLIITR